MLVSNASKKRNNTIYCDSSLDSKLKQKKFLIHFVSVAVGNDPEAGC